MNKNPQTSLTIMIAAFAITMMAAPALAETSKKSKKSAAHSSAAAAAEAVGDVPDVGSAPMAGHHDQKPGPAWRTIGGTVKQIKGDMYTVEDYEGNQVQLYVSRETKHLRGSKKVGDRVRAEITHGGFANSIQ
jgi:ribosomal protein L21E